MMEIYNIIIGFEELKKTNKKDKGKRERKKSDEFND